MGYWHANKYGAMELDANSVDVIGMWGDEPADIIETALHDIIRVYYRDFDRAPTADEISAGAEWVKSVFQSLFDRTAERV